MVAVSLKKTTTCSGGPTGHIGECGSHFKLKRTVVFVTNIEWISVDVFRATCKIEFTPVAVPWNEVTCYPIFELVINVQAQKLWNRLKIYTVVDAFFRYVLLEV